MITAIAFALLFLFSFTAEHVQKMPTACWEGGGALGNNQERRDDAQMEPNWLSPRGSSSILGDFWSLS